MPSRVVSLIAKSYPNLVLYEEKMMDESSRKDFYEYVGKGNPGFICGRFRDGAHQDCAILFAYKDMLEKGVYVLMYVMDVKSSNPIAIPINEYRCIQYGSEAYIHFLKPGYLSDRENMTQIPMKSNGFEVVFSGHTSQAYFWDNGVLRKVYTSD